MTFKAGQSGNPAGRRPGIPDKRTQLRKLLEPHQNELIEKVVSMAKEGDMSAMRLVLERLIPSYKSEAQPVVFDSMKDVEGLTEQGQAVINAIATGDIAATDGAAFITAMTQLARLVETEDLEQRIAALEEKRGH